MAKAFFLAKSFYRYCALIFRDHGTSRDLAGWIPSGVCTPAIGRLRAAIRQAQSHCPGRRGERAGVAALCRPGKAYWPCRAKLPKAFLSRATADSAGCRRAGSSGPFQGPLRRDPVEGQSRPSSCLVNVHAKTALTEPARTWRCLQHRIGVERVCVVDLSFLCSLATGGEASGVLRSIR